MAQRDGGVNRNIRGEKAAPNAVRPIGGNQEISLIQGIQGTLHSVEAAQHEVARLARDIRILNERAITLLERRDRSQRDLVSGVRRAVASGMHEAITSLGPLPVVQVGDATAEAAAPPPPEPPPAAPRPRRRAETPSDAPAMQPHPEGGGEVAQRMSNYEIYQRGRGYDLGKLRQDVARGIGRRISEFGEETLQQAPVKLTTVAGQADRWAVPLPPGVAGPPTPVDADDAARMTRRARAVANARDLAGAAASGEQGAMLRTVTGMLPRGAGVALGAATGALMLGNQALDFATNQRAVNAGWQSILGGSNAEGFRERARSQMFEFGLKGTMGAGQASELYRGVAATGMRGADRTNSLDFATDQYKRHGMAVAESLEVIDIAARSGLESLNGVAEAITSVTKAAREAGENAQVARQNFVRNFRTAAEVLGPGAAVSAAAGLATAQAGLGRQFQGVDMASMLEPQNLRSMAARAGMPFSQVMAATIRRDPAGTQLVSNLVRQNLAQTAQLGLGQQGMEIVRRFAQENRVNERTPLTPTQYEELSATLLERMPWLDPQTAQQMLSQIGLANVPINQAIGMIARIQTGDFDPGAEMMRNVQRSQQYEVQDAKGGTRENVKGVTDIGDVMVRAGGTRFEAESLTTGGKWGPFGQGKTDRARALYVKSAQKTGRGSPIIESALKQGFDPSWRFRIDTKDGPRVVTFDDLMRYAPDQAARGDVEIVRGRGEGGTLADITGMAANTSIAKTSASQVIKHGKSEEDFNRGRGKESGRVIIAPAPALGRWFTFQGQGGVSIEPNAPPPQPVSPMARPSGNPVP